MNDICRRLQESWDDAERSQERTEHLEHCESCQEFARIQERLQQSLSAWAVPEFSSDFDLQVMSRLTEETGRQPRRSIGLWELFKLRLPIPLPIGALAAFTLIVSLVLNLYFWNTRSGSSSQNAFQIPVVPVNATPQTVPLRPAGVPIEWLGSGSFLVIPIPPQNITNFANSESVQTNGTNNNT